MTIPSAEPCQTATLGAPVAGTCAGAFLRGELSAAEFRALYAARWTQTFTPRLQLGRALQIIMLRPALLGAGLRLLHRLPGVGGYLVRNTRDARVTDS